VFGGNYFLKNTEAGRNLQNEADNIENSSGYDNSSKASDDRSSAASNKPASRPKTSTSSNVNRDDVVKIGVVTWGGYAGGQYFNNGFEANKSSRFYKDYGFMVEFVVLDDFVPSREAWKHDDVDLLWATIDAFPTESGALAQFEPVVLFQSDWSRGGDAIVVRRGISKVSDLKGKKVAVAELFFAKKAYVNKNKKRLEQLYEGWMKGAAEINSSASARKRAATILSEEFTERGTALSPSEADEMIGNVRLVTHGDNKNFFGLNSAYRGVTGESLYARMSTVYNGLGHTGDKAPPRWASINYPGLVNSTTLTGDNHFPEAAKTFKKVTKADETKESIATKEVSINFRTADI